MVRIWSIKYDVGATLHPISILLAFWCCCMTASKPGDNLDFRSGSMESLSTLSKLNVDYAERTLPGKRKRWNLDKLYRIQRSVDDGTARLVSNRLERYSLLTVSLQLRREQACEGQRLVLKCPAHTQLVIQTTFFGRSVPYNELCPPQRGQQVVSSHTALTSPMPTWDERHEDISCDVSNAHSKVMEICQYRRKCKINANSKFFGRDPCPMTSKYLQVAYKCRPSRFGSECFSEGSTMQLGCKSNQRLAIYAAIYGRTVASNPGECLGGEPAVSFDCTIDVLHKFLQTCHAQSKCSLLVEDSELGSTSCPPGVKKYLNVIFICVREEVFSDSALTGQLTSEESSYESPFNRIDPTASSTQNDGELTASSHSGNVQRPRSFIPTSDSSVSATGGPRNPTDSNGSLAEMEPLGELDNFGSLSVPTSRCLPESVPNAVIQVQNWLSTYEYIRENQEKFFLYFGLSASTGIIALLLFCIVQLCWRHRGRLAEQNGIKQDLNLNRQYSPSRASSKIEIASAHTPTVFDEGRVELTDFGRDGISFLRFNHPTPPRNTNKNVATPAVSIAAAPSFQAHEFYS